MTTTSFLLLKLPLIPLELIINRLDFFDLLQLSMKSSKFKRRLELLKLSVYSLQLSVTQRLYRIEILQNRNFCYIDVCDSVPVDTITELANIQGEPVHIWSDGRDEVKVKSDLSKLATLETITKYILSITKIAKYSLTYNDAKTEIRSLFVWQITTQMHLLHVSPNNGISITMSPEDLKFLLDGISVECLILDVSCPDFKYQRSIRHPVINISSPSWIDFDQFSFGSETITAEFRDQKVSNPVLNRLIKDWTEGKNPKLREVKFKWEDSNPEILAMVREHQARPAKPILPNRNIDKLKGLCINYSITYQSRLWHPSVFYEVRLSVEDQPSRRAPDSEAGNNGIHLAD